MLLYAVLICIYGGNQLGCYSKSIPTEKNNNNR